MQTLHQLLVLLAASVLSGGLEDNLYQDYDAFGEQDVTVPPCATDEFLTSNGTHFLCQILPDVGFCDCPGLNTTPTPGVGNQTSTPVAPLPPSGCPVLSPPTRGAYACLRSPTAIYCSVLCDHRFEFSSSPRNPYYCGEATLFNWRDYPNGAIRTSLPECTGFRHRLRLLHPYENYLPAPCYGLSDHTAWIILQDLFAILKDGCSDCVIEDSYIECAQVPASAQLYSDVANARTD
ncbi:uncharacterized protein LOC135349355 [Halichondria panicea]|uniref:uncharacterized protein LOC135349355 n=1 Tax=Halichondria panicea TaxID=6063 RepID=UPI00312B35CA